MSICEVNKPAERRIRKYMHVQSSWFLTHSPYTIMVHQQCALHSEWANMWAATLLDHPHESPMQVPKLPSYSPLIFMLSISLSPLSLC